MIRNCERCHRTYDDAEAGTFCPHELLMSHEDLEQKKLGIKLIGKKVRFAHMPPGSEVRVTSCGWTGMVTLEGFVGEFAPHLFVSLVED